jgi:hypothetical protein
MPFNFPVLVCLQPKIFEQNKTNLLRGLIKFFLASGRGLLELLLVPITVSVSMHLLLVPNIVSVIMRHTRAPRAVSALTP